MMHIVFFSPEDLSIIKEGPAGRRRFLDMELSQIDKGYMQQLVAYSKILNERNNLLKQINLYPALKSGELIFVNLAHKDSKGRLRCH